ncbi:uncharacterized protein EKO05_0008179 [Ascochyta rabiei]|uniref:uncharacterized protein n=1 Tax=Didymella rabiei TaxID=5454 RepID=UPI00220C693C|nr:uncharacterized protein EKO05_0008179 [Ascochyta rabiei]UPX17852.1 hypothetical protein EKO05_0008179 [Ascochyta rabiei]
MEQSILRKGKTSSTLSKKNEKKLTIAGRQGKPHRDTSANFRVHKTSSRRIREHSQSTNQNINRNHSFAFNKTPSDATQLQSGFNFSEGLNDWPISDFLASLDQWEDL